MNTYTLLRKIHLYAGLVLLVFVIMYFVTGYPMIHRAWFPKSEADKSTRVEAFSYSGANDPEAYSNHLQRTFGLYGKAASPQRRKDGSWQFRYSRPGTQHEAVVSPAGDSVTITTRQEGVVETMIAFHEFHGYGGGLLYSLWALLLDLTSLAMILFSVSGIYLWYRLTKKRLLGWICLGISFTFTSATILFCMYAP